MLKTFLIVSGFLEKFEKYKNDYNPFVSDTRQSNKTNDGHIEFLKNDCLGGFCVA